MSADKSRDAFAWAHGHKAARRLPLIEQYEYENAAREHRELLKEVTAVIKPSQSVNAKPERNRAVSAAIDLISICEAARRSNSSMRDSSDRKTKCVSF